jgi:6-pyruvoyltetrahydropterin/6-carboxytetrahydropterin synthase
MYELKVVTRFAAAHQLTMVGSKCENMHGHNWKIEVYVTGNKLNAGGVLVDFGEIKAHLADVMKKLDHKFLNELDYIPDGNPSSENIAYFVATELQSKIDNSSARAESAGLPPGSPMMHVQLTLSVVRRELSVAPLI